jgi:hypothetical protein
MVGKMAVTRPYVGAMGLGMRIRRRLEVSGEDGETY